VIARRPRSSPKAAPSTGSAGAASTRAHVFPRLLGDTNHGRWSIAPAAVASDIKVSRPYDHNTLILETEFTSADGKNAVVLVDFMPLREGRNSPHLVRLVVGKRGSMAMRTEWIVRFGYGGWVPWVSRSGPGDLVAIAGPDMVVMRAPVELRGEGLTTVGISSSPQASGCRLF
jgi:GH15 family glucan-1,4-alpha-glucosidase